MKELTLKKVKQYAAEHGKEIVYNRSRAGYQVKTSPISYSECVYPAVIRNKNGKGKIYWTQGDLRKLINLI